MLRSILFTTALHVGLASTSTPTWTCPATDCKHSISASSMVQKRYELGHVTVTDEDHEVLHNDRTAVKDDVSHGGRFQVAHAAAKEEGPPLHVGHAAGIKEGPAWRARDNDSTSGMEEQPPSQVRDKDIIFTILDHFSRCTNRMHFVLHSPITTWILFGPLLLVAIGLVAIFVVINFFGSGEEQSNARRAAGKPRQQEAGSSSAAPPDSLVSQSRGFAAGADFPATRKLHGPTSLHKARQKEGTGISALWDSLTGRSVLCSSLVNSEEAYYTVHSLRQARSGEIVNHEVKDKENVKVLHVRLRPGRDDDQEAAGGPAQPDAEVLELLTEEKGELLAFCALPSHDFAACADICRPEGTKFGKVKAELEFNRFAISFPDGKWMITGDFSKHNLRITSEDGQPIARTESGISKKWLQATIELNAKKMQIFIAPNVDAGLVLCGLLVTDRVVGAAFK